MTAGRLVLLFTCPLAQELGALADRLGWPVTLVDPDRALLDAGPVPYARCELALATARLDATCDVVVCDPDRPELDAMLEELLTTDVRRIGVHGGTGRVTAPVDLTRVRLDVGLKLGARSPAEAAVSIIGELIADRNGA